MGVFPREYEARPTFMLKHRLKMKPVSVSSIGLSAIREDLTAGFCKAEDLSVILNFHFRLDSLLGIKEDLGLYYLQFPYPVVA